VNLHILPQILKRFGLFDEEGYERGSPAWSSLLCYSVKGENDENQEVVYSFGRDFLCLDHCDRGCLWLVEEIKTDLLIIEKWVRN
jgi:hypothetical protein